MDQLWQWDDSISAAVDILMLRDSIRTSQDVVPDVDSHIDYGEGVSVVT